MWESGQVQVPSGSERWPQGHSCVAMLQPVVKSSKFLINPAYPKTIVTLGDHLRKKRLDLKLEQKDVAKLLKITPDSIYLWENNRVEPKVDSYPTIVNFLGYCPFEPLTDFGQKLKRHRIYSGLSLGQFAKILVIDPGTLRNLEAGGRTTKKVRAKVETFLQSLGS